MSSNEIQHEETDTKGRFFLRSDGAEAELTYSKAGETTLIADHTGVPESLGGRGIGLLLAQALVDMARERGLTILPLCPFVARKSLEHPEWGDVMQIPRKAR